MKVTIELGSEHIPALENWMVEHGGMITEREELGDVVRLAVENAGPSYITAVREFREESGMGFRESKEFVISRDPMTMLFSRDQAERIKKNMERAGATVRLFS